MRPEFTRAHALLAACVLWLGTGRALGAQGEAAAYPPVKNPSVIHAFSLPDDLKADAIKKALAELSTKEADCGIRYGPLQATSRPNRVFVLVEAPATRTAKDVIGALKKGAKSVEQTSWTCFKSKDATLGRGLGGGMPGLTPRDFLLGISNDLRWVEAGGGISEFFFTPGKLDAKFIEDRFHKLAAPFGVKDIGVVLRETITWPLAEPIDPAAAKRVEKDILRIAGVRSAKIDILKHEIELEVALEDQVRGALPGALAGFDNTLGAALAAEKDKAPRMRFDTNPIFDALEKEKIVVAAQKESASVGGK